MTFSESYFCVKGVPFMKKIRILLGSCGGLTGLYLSKLFKKIDSNLYEIFGFDANNKNPTKFFLDKFIVIPNSSDEEHFLSSLIQLLNNEKIDVYLPLHSSEIRVISKYEDYIKSLSNTKFIVSEFRSFMFLDNKKNLYISLADLGIRVPKIFDENTPPLSNEFPIFFKPEIGSGSKGTMIVETKEEFEFLKKQKGIFLEFLNGTEYTVDAIFDQEGKLLGYNQRIRLKTLGGAAIVTQNNYEVDVGDYLALISSHYKIKGPANFQFFKTFENEIVFTDVNLRFPSGGLPLSVESGINIPLITIKLSLGENITPQECVPDRKKRTMYRYFEEIFEEE